LEAGEAGIGIVSHQIELSGQAERQLRKLEPDIQSLVGAAIESLAIVPRPSGAKKLKGEDNVYRIRVRNYRVLYEIQDHELIVLVIKIGHRREVYR
jgi:mRNA interferase RelE/StbE